MSLIYTNITNSNYTTDLLNLENWPSNYNNNNNNNSNINNNSSSNNNNSSSNNSALTIDETLCNILQKNYSNSRLTFTCGPVLLILNPFTSGQAQLNATPSDYDFAIKRMAGETLDHLVASGINQTVFFTGETGSGKTFSSQRLMKEILQLSTPKRHSTHLGTDLFKTVLASITVLRALCFAKTASSPDSSRVMHLFELIFSGRCLVGAKFRCYFLNQSRINAPLPHEQNYNIFYQMLVGVSPGEKSKLRLDGYTIPQLRILTGCQLPQESPDILIRKYEALKSCLSTLAIPHLDVLRVLTAVLLLGNVEFKQDIDGRLKVIGEKELYSSAVLLGVPYRHLREAILSAPKFDTVTDSATNNSIIFTVCHANSNIKGLTRSLYTRLLGVILRRINDQLIRYQYYSQSTNDTSNNSNTVSLTIADMFGFDNNSNNNNIYSSSSSSSIGGGLEQLCANWTAEKLQQCYYECVFKVTYEALINDGLEPSINYDSCSRDTCLSLLTHPSTGVFQSICQLADSNNDTLVYDSDSRDFVSKMKTNHNNNLSFKHLPTGTGLFVVSHFAGDVAYDSKKLLEDNIDILPGTLVNLFRSDACTCPFMTILFSVELSESTSLNNTICHITPPPITTTTTNNTTTTTTTTNNNNNSGKSSPISRGLSSYNFINNFHTRLSYFFEIIKESQPHFVRCIKPNNDQKREYFNVQVVLRQLHAASLIQTLQLVSDGLIYNYAFNEFKLLYGKLIPSKNDLNELNDKQFCHTVLQHFDARFKKIQVLTNTAEKWTLGHSHVFLSSQAHLILENCRQKQDTLAAVTIQRFFRSYLKRKYQHANIPRHVYSLFNRDTPRSYESHSDSPQLSTPDEHDGQNSSHERAPSLPAPRGYTIVGDYKVPFPQLRIIIETLEVAGSFNVVLNEGQTVTVLGVGTLRDQLSIDYNGTVLEIPYRYTMLPLNMNTTTTYI